MRCYRWAGVLVLAGLMIGCANRTKPKSPPPPPATPADLGASRAELNKIDPRIRIGLVIAVLPEEHMAAVGEVALKDFRVGDAVTFTDSQHKVVGNGTIIVKTDDALHVRYESVRRVPMVGDLAVRLVK